MSYQRNLIVITGILPDNALPSISLNDDPTSVVLYYRNDENLYLYDFNLSQEFDLFNMSIDASSLDCVVNPFDYV